MRKKSPLPPQKVTDFVDSLFGEDLHAKRVLSLANGTLGVLNAGALGVFAIGRGLAHARGLDDRHGIKQVDRLLSNAGIDLDDLFEEWVPFVLEGKKKVVINMDWTEFDQDNHSMLVMSTQTGHGRSMPLLWTTEYKSLLKNKRNDHEDRLLAQLAGLLPEGVEVTIVADRGFGDSKLYAFLEELSFEHVIRFKGDILVTDEKGETRPAKEWVGVGGRMRVIKNATVTAGKHPVSKVVVVHQKGMKDAWCLAVSNEEISGPEVKKLYGKRFTCEEMFRDMKDLRFGMGMKWQRIKQPVRRDRMFLMAAMAYSLLTLLGEAGERVGLDRVLKANTVKHRTMSLFRQGLRWYELIDTMKEDRLHLLMGSFDALVREKKLYHAAFGVL